MSTEQYKLDLAKGQLEAALINRDSAQRMKGLVVLINSILIAAMIWNNFNFMTVAMVTIGLMFLGHYYHEGKTITNQIGTLQAEILKREDLVQAQLPINKEW